MKTSPIFYIAIMIGAVLFGYGIHLSAMWATVSGTYILFVVSVLEAKDR